MKRWTEPRILKLAGRGIEEICLCKEIEKTSSAELWAAASSNCRIDIGMAKRLLLEKCVRFSLQSLAQVICYRGQGAAPRKRYLARMQLERAGAKVDEFPLIRNCG